MNKGMITADLLLYIPWEYLQIRQPFITETEN
jgi:hypothetical protein